MASDLTLVLLTHFVWRRGAGRKDEDKTETVETEAEYIFRPADQLDTYAESFRTP